jgi:hypothetical protein
MESKKMPFEIRELDPALKKFIDDRMAEMKDSPIHDLDFVNGSPVTFDSYHIPDVFGALEWTRRALEAFKLMRKISR